MFQLNLSLLCGDCTVVKEIPLNRVHYRELLVAGSILDRMQGRLFGDTGWNPRAILARIALQQGAFYAAYASSLVLLALTVGTSLHTDYIWSSKRVSVLTSFGWAGIVSWVVADVVSCWALPYTAQRAKRCWDYSATVLILHTALSTLYDTFPTHWDWWVMAAMSFIMTTTLGEWLCMRVEMADISVDTILHRPQARSSDIADERSARAPRLDSNRDHESRVFGTLPSSPLARRSSSMDDKFNAASRTSAEIESSPLLRGRANDATAGRGSHSDLAGELDSTSLSAGLQAPHTPARVSTLAHNGSISNTPGDTGSSGGAAQLGASPQSKAASLVNLFSSAGSSAAGALPGSGGSRQRGGGKVA